MYLKELEIYDNESLENEFIECNKNYFVFSLDIDELKIICDISMFHI